MTNTTCETCPWWEKLPVGDIGLCRVNAPVVIYAGEGDFYSKWPITYETDWCGEHPDITMQMLEPERRQP